MLIAYLGPEATFTHQAAVKKFGQSIDYLATPAIPDVFHTVAKGEYGVIPIENSTGGSVLDSMDMFFDSELKICSDLSDANPEPHLSVPNRRDQESLLEGPGHSAMP